MSFWVTSRHSLGPIVCPRSPRTSSIPFTVIVMAAQHTLPPMSFEEIRYEIADHVLTITLNRPDRLNAFTPTMASELMEAFDTADADDDVRVVIVPGEGRGFCAGADLIGGGDTFDWRDRQKDGGVPRDTGGQVVLRIYGSLKPVIAAINGPAVGVGITMTLPMDIRI